MLTLISLAAGYDARRCPPRWHGTRSGENRALRPTITETPGPSLGRGYRSSNRFNIVFGIELDMSLAFLLFPLCLLFISSLNIRITISPALHVSKHTHLHAHIDENSVLIPFLVFLFAAPAQTFYFCVVSSCWQPLPRVEGTSSFAGGDEQKGQPRVIGLCCWARWCSSSFESVTGHFCFHSFW